MSTTSPGVLIAGEWTAVGDELAVIDPSDGTTIDRIPFGGKAEALAAADAAAAAFPAWSSGAPADRVAVLTRTAALLSDRAVSIGRLLARETGKRLAEAEAEVRFAADYFTWFAHECRRPSGELLPIEGGRERRVTRHASGVVACLTPWNFPVSIPARKLAAALAAGCTVVLRPSEKAPLATIELVRALVDAGVADGAVNLIHGAPEEQAAALLSHPGVRVLSFTGSTAVGRRLLAQASERLIRPLLELGGNAPFLVFADADVDAAVEGAVLAKFRNNGQSCIAANRFLVEASVFDAFVDRFGRAVASMQVAPVLATPACDLGPLIDEGAADRVRRLVADAQDSGARLVTRPVNLPARATFCGPALVADVPSDAPLVREEVFGPVASVTPFASEAEAIELANSTEFGLAAYAYTRDLERVRRLTAGLEVGVLGVNTGLPAATSVPMGGVKFSGLGREGGRAGLEEFLDVRSVTIG